MEQACYICPSVTCCAPHKIVITIMIYDTFIVIKIQIYPVLLREQIIKFGA
jgi:hypothetical protein